MRIRIAFIISLALIFSFDIFLTVIVGIARGVTRSALLALPESNRRAASPAESKPGRRSTKGEAIIININPRHKQSCTEDICFGYVSARLWQKGVARSEQASN